MKAIGFKQHGGLDELHIFDLPKPEPSPKEVLIKIHASALNHLDLFVLQGWPGLQLTLPHIAGSDGAGVIEALGDEVQGWQVGQRVAIDPGFNLFEDQYTAVGLHSVSPGYRIIGEHSPGTHAEYVTVPAQNIIALPDHITFEHAAAVGLVATTAWRMLIHRAHIKLGESVLIIGAGGGVNSMAIQMAKLAGCEVFALTSTKEKMVKAVELGADQVINYHEDPQWYKTIFAMTNKKGVDCVVDNVGAATINNSMRCVKNGGRIVIVGNTSGPNVEIDLRILFAKQISLLGSTMGNHDDYHQAMQLLFNGKIQPVIDDVLPLSNGIAAFRKMAEGKQFGKLLIQST